MSTETVERKRKLATIRPIGEITPIMFAEDWNNMVPAENIEQVKVEGWRLIAKKGEFNTGDKCVYFEVDSVLPEKDWSEFLRKKHFMVRTLKYNKFAVLYKDVYIVVISSGLALPLSSFGDEMATLLNSMEIGADVTDLLEVKKKEDTVTFFQGDDDGHFLEGVPKTDQLRVESYLGAIADLEKRAYTITEKYDGTSCTAMYSSEEGKLIVCSRNLRKKDHEKSVYWNAMRQYENVLRANPNIVIQGEIVGPAIQKNPRQLDKQMFYCYNIYDNNVGRHYTSDEWVKFCEKHNIPTVNIVERGEYFNHTLEYLENLSKQSFTDNPSIKTEGIVVRDDLNAISPSLDGRLTFKVLNEEYDL